MAFAVDSAAFAVDSAVFSAASVKSRRALPSEIKDCLASVVSM